MSSYLKVNLARHVAGKTYAEAECLGMPKAQGQNPSIQPPDSPDKGAAKKEEKSAKKADKKDKKK